MIKIRIIKQIDKEVSKFIFKLRNKAYVRKNSLNKAKISHKNHQNWVKKFNKKNNKLYLIKYNKTLIGYIRLELKKKIYNASWALIKKFQGKGLAKRGLNLATKNKQKKYIAIIKENNLASLKVAYAAKFRLTSKKKNILYLSKN